MTRRALIYGATGFSGMMLAETLADLGAGLVVAARKAEALAKLTTQLGIEGRVFALQDAAAIDAALADIDVVLNCAGPFRETAMPMLAACLRSGTDYLDLAGEWPVFDLAQSLAGQATTAGIMLLPGVGFAIAASDCLLALTVREARDSVRLRLAISRPHRIVRGSMLTILHLNDAEVRVRRQGKIVELPAGRLSREFDFGRGNRHAVAVTWPDIYTAEATTGVGTIEAYTEADWATQALVVAGAAMAPLTQSDWAQPWLRAASAFCPATNPVTAESGFTLVAEAEDPWRRVTTLRLLTRDGHTVTTATAGAALRRVLNGERTPGFTTPAQLFGPEFILGLGCAELSDRTP